MTTESAARPAGRPRVPVLEREAAMTLRPLSTPVWGLVRKRYPRPVGTAPDCPGWDVRAVAGHMLGMAQMTATLPALARQQMAAQQGSKKTGTVMIDVFTALQVAENAGLSPAEVVIAMRATGPKAARLRRKMPAFIRSRTMPGTMTVGNARSAGPSGSSSTSS